MAIYIHETTSKKVLLSSLLLISIVFATFLFSILVNALNGSDFKAGRIIDDAVFYNSSTMSAASIQSFLNAKVPTCDTNGSKIYSGTTTRAQYGASNGYPAPYTCLKNYTQAVPNIINSGSDLCGGSISSGTKSAASIIYDVSKACGINPQVLIVLLQKEQSLVTDDWPWSIQYRSATGYGCPDTAPCDSEYYGFFNQVYQAAKAFKRYAANPANYNYRYGRNNTVLWHPNAACGSSTVYIENQATANLYIYTPYRPNQAAINNLYGSGDSCSSYGNRNFWRMFNDWFVNSLVSAPYSWSLESQTTYSDQAMTQKFTSVTTASPGTKIYVIIRARNTGRQTWSNSFIRLGTSKPKDRSSKFYDSSWIAGNRPVSLKESSVKPGEVGTFEFAMKAPSTNGSYKEYFNIVAENRTWLNDIGLFLPINVVSAKKLNYTIPSGLPSGGSLTKNQYLVSPDSNTVLKLQSDDNLVLYRNFKAVWSSKTKGKNASNLVMQSDGNLVLYSVTNSALWNSRTYGNPGSTLDISSLGNAVIHDGSDAVLWTSNSDHVPNLLGYVNTYTTLGRTMHLGQRIQTADRKLGLVLQTDGNLVLYNSAGKAIWHTRTSGLQ